MYKPGDFIIFRTTKFSPHPGPRAKNVHPNPKGELYRYQVDKFWMVVEVQEDGSLLARTNRGKEHVLDPTDVRVRKPNWFERLIYWNRFSQLRNPPEESAPKSKHVSA